jgi:hypothetical protein
MYPFTVVRKKHENAFFGLTKEPFQLELSIKEILETPDLVSVAKRVAAGVRSGKKVEAQRIFMSTHCVPNGVRFFTPRRRWDWARNQGQLIPRTGWKRNWAR